MNATQTHLPPPPQTKSDEFLKNFSLHYTKLHYGNHCQGVEGRRDKKKRDSSKRQLKNTNQNSYK